jgi:multiple sugar transport system substrate-binding protein
MTSTITRRDIGRLLAGGAAAATLASVGSLAAAADSIRLIWWGNPDRDRRTNEVVALFAKEKGIAVTPETYGWGDYWQKLATQAAGRNLPDVIQMDYRFLFEYARRRQLAALDEFVGNQIDLANFDPNQLASGKVDDKLYGISMGANSMSHIYRKEILAKAGVTTLPDQTTWTDAEFDKLGEQVKGALPDGMYFTQNMGYNEPSLETWVRQRGKALYTEDGQLGYELADLEAFFARWKDLQDKGLTPPADVMAGDASQKAEDTMIVTGKSLFGFSHSNQLVAYQKLIPDEVDIVMIPNQEGGKPGQYLKPSMLISMAETSGAKDAAAELIAFFITDPGANAILQIERGVSGDPAIRESIVPSLGPTEKKIIDYLDVVGTHVGPLPPPPPKNAGELDRALRPAWDEVAFGKLSVTDGAKKYYDNAVAILGRA